MGTVYAGITLKNAADAVRVRDGHVKPSDVKEITVNAMVDTGTGTIAITEEIFRQLGLEVVSLRNSTLANDDRIVCKVTEPVTIKWKDRETDCRAIVVPGASEVLIGVIPLEDMDLIVNPGTRQLEGAHGDEVLCLLK